MSAGTGVLRIRGVPSERQREFFASRARYTAYGGARGGGKSWALRRKLLGLCLNYPGIRCLLVRRTLSEVKSNHLEPLLSECGGLAVYSEGERSIRFPGGSVIILGYCACDRDLLRYQGQEYDIIAIDEATQLTEHQFSSLCATLRGVNDFPKRVYLTCNPGGVGHAWVKRLFIDRDFREGESPSDYSFIPARVYDNEALMRSNPSYADRLKSLPPRLRDAWLYGRWDVFEGQFFGEFCEKKHIIKSDSVPNNAKFFVSLDYGLDMLATLLLAVGDDGRLYAVRELLVPSLTLGEAGRAVVDFIGSARAEYVVASPDLWNRRQDSGRSGFEVMQAVRGMPPMVPADNRRVPGWRILHEYLSDTPDGARLLVCEGCGELIFSMQSLLCDPNRPEDAASEPHSVTHAPEALRYAVMSRFSPPSTGEADEPLPFSFARRGGAADYLSF